ncbi:piggyBac transposable element-derived protein 4-like [Anastrepha ludens]|uniref:piggyBac transposable element-derived protein 4-like n=1 Tax=Anastrepha ludens TaxID=28586 RepID=UPI0023AECA3E|nr:piggyBac transposable element-derived protein 4-like [Anastrepha ludens]
MCIHISVLFFDKSQWNFLEMNVRSFYGNLKYVYEVNRGDQCDDDYISDTDEEDFISKPPEQEHIYVPETDDTDDSDDYNKPSTSNAKPAKKPRAPIWKEICLPPYSSENFPFQGDSNLPDFIEELETPADMFNFIFNDDLMNFIVEQSNLIALQMDINKPANITRNEIDQFIGITIYMSLIKLPSSRHYWNTFIGQEFVRNAMTCNRWQNIKRFLHFNNNENIRSPGELGFDKLFKIRPLLDKIRARFLLVPKEEHLVVDEQIIPTKCRHHLKQYNPAKPHK